MRHLAACLLLLAAPVHAQAPDGGAPLGVAVYDSATRLLAQRLSAGVALYYQVAERGDGDAIAALRRDLALIAPAAELATLDTLTSTTRRDWLRAWWEARDIFVAQPMGARLMEHYRRIAFASRTYPISLNASRRRAAEQSPWAGLPYDDRGVIYVRHGPPASVRSSGSDGASDEATSFPLNETWQYAFADTVRAFHFLSCRPAGRGAIAACAMPRSYFLIPSLLDLFGPAMKLGMRTGSRVLNPATAPPGVQAAMLARVGLDPVYSQLFNGDKYTQPVAAEQEIRTGEAHLAWGTTHDSFEPGYARDVQTRFEVLAAGTAGGKTLLHVGFAARAGDLEPKPIGRPKPIWRYTLETRGSAWDSTGAQVGGWLRRLTTEFATRVAGDESIMGLTRAAVSPGSLTLRMVLEQDAARGTITPPVPLLVPDLSGRTFELGDVLMGVEGAFGSWMPGVNDTIWINPSGRYERNVPIATFLQVAGLPAGTGYGLEYVVGRRRREPGVISDTLVTVFFTSQSTGAQTNESRSLDVSRLAPGAYRLRATVRLGDGRRKERYRDFEVVAGTPARTANPE